MKKIILAPLISVLFLMVIVSSCKKDASDPRKELIFGSSGVDTLRDSVTFNTTVTRTTYLQGTVYVKSGVTLTINPGVTITGSSGNQNQVGILVIQQGAKLIANGDAFHPIVWTGFTGWGGLVIMGKATIHNNSGGTTNSYLFLPSDPRNIYGGTDDDDNSGSITYNRFEYAGALVSGGETGGVTLCGVGRGTAFNHIAVNHSLDDGFLFFGGAVNGDHLLCFDPTDDEYNFNEGYHGNLQFIIGYRLFNRAPQGSHGIEEDNDAAGTNFTPHTLPFIANATLVGPVDTPGPFRYFDGEILLRRYSRLRLVNSLIIAQKQPYAFVVTPTTCPLMASVASLADSIVVAYNIWQSNSINPVEKSSVETTPVLPFFDPCSGTILGKLVGLNNTALPSFSDFKLDGTLTPLAGSPALSGGVNLAALSLPFFVGTTQRGAVITTDKWTSHGTWIM